jgi:hypothetical protein
MMGKLPKSEAWKQSDLGRLRLLLYPRYSSKDSLLESIGFWQSFRTRANRAEKPCRTPKDSGRAFALELRRGLLIGREALRPSESRHSHDKAMPSYYTKNGCFASRISKCGVCVEFRRQGVFIGVPRAVTDLIKSIIHQVLAGRPSSAASTDSRPQVPFHHLLKSITAKETHGRLQSGAGRPPNGPTH